MLLKHELLSTQRLSISAEEFSEQSKRKYLHDLLRNKDNLKYIASLVLSTRMFVARDWVEELSEHTTASNGPKIPIVADVSLSGGYAGMPTEVSGIVERYGFFDSTITLSRMPADQIGYAKNNITVPSNKHTVNLLITGALPENDTEEFYKKYKVGKRQYTEEALEEAVAIGVDGVYASAGLIPYDAPIFSLGAGVSFDGLPYMSHGVLKRSVSVEEGPRRCSNLLVGQILFSEERTVEQNFQLLCEKIDET